MVTEHSHNPYATPRTSDLPVEDSHRPGVLAQIGMIVAVAFASGFTFLLTCAGVGTLGIWLFPGTTGLLIIFTGTIAGLIVATLAGMQVRRDLIRSASQNQNEAYK